MSDKYKSNNLPLPLIRTFPLTDTDDMFSSLLARANIPFINAPAIEIIPKQFKLPHPDHFYNWIVFTSKNAIKPYLQSQAIKPGQKIAVIGEQTAKHARSLGIEPDFTGQSHSGRGFAREIESWLNKESKVLLVLGQMAPGQIQDTLGQKFHVDRVNVYETVMPRQVNNLALDAIKKDMYSLIAITSPSAVDNLLSLINLDYGLRFASIGETTSARLRARGIEPVTTAGQQSYESLARAIIEEISKNR